MGIGRIYTHGQIADMADKLFLEERARTRLDGWFYIKEIQQEHAGKFAALPLELRAANTLKEVAKALPLELSEHAIFAGTQRDAFARSYALISPRFEVKEFSGYCDPTAVFDDIEPEQSITAEKVAAVRERDRQSDYVRQLADVYKKAEGYTSEVIFFIEQVTGHLIPDVKPVLALGVTGVIAGIESKLATETDEERKVNYTAMKTALEAVLILAERYANLAREQAKTADHQRKAALESLAEMLGRVPANGAANLPEAIQSFLLLWQVMCIEQSPNPYAFSVGNADRIFEPYRAKENLSREMTAALFGHFLTFFNVGDRSWAISQNIIVGGKDAQGSDLTSESTYALLDAFYKMNLPQPILSVKLHRGTPAALYEAMGRFFLTPGTLTPSLFNDDAIFDILRNTGVDEDDLENYSIAGCQEPLIMGKDNGNTTNSWLNLGKILELTLSDGVSAITGENIGRKSGCPGAAERLSRVRELFYANVEFYAGEMAGAANGASRALSNLRVPFLSALMGGVVSGYDLRDTQRQGTKYNGSGCLIHGLAVVADSFVAIDKLLAERPGNAERLVTALKTNFENDEELREFLLSAPKFGNNIDVADTEVAEVAIKVSAIVAGQKNYLGNPFRPDFSTPSTHLLYGYWVGATPNGRKAREMLSYGVDPLHGDAQNGLGFRTLSALRLPYDKMSGGYASHFGIDPKYFKATTHEENGLEFRDKVVGPLFFNSAVKTTPPFYLYVNITTAEILRKVLASPKKYAPSGVYIMRIHGTFVNFLDLSPAIQHDIIARLDPRGSAIVT